MKHCVMLYGNLKEIFLQKERCLYPPSFLGALSRKFLRKGVNRKPPYIPVHPSLFCLATPMVIKVVSCDVYDVNLYDAIGYM